MFLPFFWEEERAVALLAPRVRGWITPDSGESDAPFPLTNVAQPIGSI